MPRNESADFADRLGYDLVLLGLDDTRSLVNGERRRWCVAKGGQIMRQFANASERFEWLEGQANLRDLPKHPAPKPMKP